MAVYEIEGEQYEIPDDVQGEKLIETLTMLSEQTAIQTKSVNKSEELQTSIMDDIDRSIVESVPLGGELAEFAAGANRSLLGFLDFVGLDNVNAALELAGSDVRIPTLTEMLGAPQGSFTDTGLAQDIASGAGQALPLALSVGQAFRQVAKNLPQVGQTTAQRIVADASKTTPSAEIGGTTAAVVGQELGERAGEAVGGNIGRDIGGLTGSVLAPLAAIKAVGGMRSFLSQPSTAAQLRELPDKVAEKVLFEAMRREGMDVPDVARMLDDLGDDAVLADAGDVFRRNLRAIVNKVPNMEGATRNALNQRQVGQSARIINAFDEASGLRSLDVDDQISLLNIATKPRITALYDQARSKPIQASPQLKNLLEGTSSVAKARRKAEAVLTDMRATGKQVSNIDQIDATKQVLDDQIGSLLRQGKNNAARRIIELKNLMVKEADEAIPEYKQARDLFAGKANLENSATLGESVFRMSPSDVKALTKSMGESERKMFVLGAKKAIIGKIDAADVNANAVKRIFGKRGDIERMKYLFPDNKSYQDFSRAMRREAEFIVTRNAAQGNSTTMKQAEDIAKVSKFFDIEPTANPMQFARRIAAKRAAATSDAEVRAFEDGLQKAGELLIKQDGAKDVLSVLMKASDDNLNRVLNSIYPDSLSSRIGTASLVAGSTNEEKE